MAAAAATSTATSIVTAACGVESLSCEKGKLVVCAVAANELVSAEMSVAWGFFERRYAALG